MGEMQAVFAMLGGDSFTGLLTDMKVSMAAIIGISLVICGLSVVVRVLDTKGVRSDVHGRVSEGTYGDHRAERKRHDRIANWDESESTGEHKTFRLRND